MANSSILFRNASWLTRSIITSQPWLFRPNLLNNQGSILNFGPNGPNRSLVIMGYESNVKVVRMTGMKRVVVWEKEKVEMPGKRIKRKGSLVMIGYESNMKNGQNV